VGINIATLKVQNVDSGDFCIKLALRSKYDGFEWAPVPVYGAAQDNHKHEFLSELVLMCDAEPLPMLLAEILTFLGFPLKKIKR
jgi:hypothetical protein